MNKAKYYFSTFILVLNGLFSQTISATPIDFLNNFYLGAYAGYSQFGVECLADTNLDDDGFAYQFLAGYRFLAFFAAEAGFVNPANYPYSGTGFSEGYDINGKLYSFYLAAKGIYPLQQAGIDLYALAGGMLTHSTVEITMDSNTIHSDTENSLDPLVGVGATFLLSKHVEAGIQYQYVPNVTVPDNRPSADLHMVSMGVIYKFT